MLTVELQKEVVEILEDCNFGRIKQKGRGYARRVYELNENYVIKIESLRITSDSRLESRGKHGIIKIRRILNSYLENPDAILSYMDRKNLEVTLERFTKFLDFLDLTFSSQAIEIYVSFLDGSPSLQNVPEYLNYMTLKGTELGEFITTSLGIIFTRNYSVIVQEKGKVTEERTRREDNKARDFFTEVIQPKFTKSGYRLKDIHDDNLVITKDGKAKICDTGCCTLNEFDVSNY